MREADVKPWVYIAELECKVKAQADEIEMLKSELLWHQTKLLIAERNVCQHEPLITVTAGSPELNNNIKYACNWCGHHVPNQHYDHCNTNGEWT